MSRPISADGPPTGDTGTKGYAAPEQLSANAAHTPKTDVFTFGLILYEIIRGEPVFDPNQTLVRKLRSEQFPAIPDEFGSFMQDLIPRCWAHDPQNRPSFQDIFDEFQTVDFEILPSVNRSFLKQSVSEVLAWEAENAASKK
jgi:serine/threonine protein kinase